MIPTLSYIQAHFQEYNATIFGNRLPALPIRIGNAKTRLGGLHYYRKKNFWGMEVYSDFTMMISTRYDLPEEEVQDTLIHEMIHYYILYNQWHDNAPHGKMFLSLMNEINARFGRHISVSHKMSGEDREKDNKINAHYVCISELEDGRMGITLAAKSRIFDLWHDLPRCFKIKNFTWYGTGDPYFNRFPRALKPKIYLADAEQVRLHLKGAVELENDGQTIRPKKHSTNNCV